MNTKIINGMVKHHNVSNKKVTFLNKVSAWTIVITFGMMKTVQKSQKANKNHNEHKQM